MLPFNTLVFNPIQFQVSLQLLYLLIF